jgi:hypothetical protein
MSSYIRCSSQEYFPTTTLQPTNVSKPPDFLRTANLVEFAIGQNSILSPQDSAMFVKSLGICQLNQLQPYLEWRTGHTKPAFWNTDMAAMEIIRQTCNTKPFI